MKKTIAKSMSALLVLLTVVVLTMAFQQETAHAAFNDRSPEGATVMPSSRTLEVPVNSAFKINFGNEYDYTNFYYFKIKPTKKGYITFTSDYVHGYSVALLNSSKNLISVGDSSFDDFYSAGSQYKYQTFINYGVKKGVTYYIRVKGASTEREEYGKPYVGSIKWTNSAVKPAKSGSKKSKAKSLKRKKTIKGLVVAGDKKAKWYKITTKRKTIRLLFKAPKTNGSIKITTIKRMYGHKGKWIKNTYTASRGGNYVSGPTTNPNGTKWTMYLKVQRKGKASGYYTLKWK